MKNIIEQNIKKKIHEEKKTTKRNKKTKQMEAGCKTTCRMTLENEDEEIVYKMGLGFRLKPAVYTSSVAI